MCTSNLGSGQENKLEDKTFNYGEIKRDTVRCWAVITVAAESERYCGVYDQSKFCGAGETVIVR